MESHVLLSSLGVVMVVERSGPVSGSTMCVSRWHTSPQLLVVVVGNLLLSRSGSPWRHFLFGRSIHDWLVLLSLQRLALVTEHDAPSLCTKNDTCDFVLFLHDHNWPACRINQKEIIIFF